jgi:hypothetical protein
MRRVLHGIVLLLVLIPGISRGTTLTASDVLTRARVYLRDQSTSANRQQFPDATLLQFLSDGQREANAQNWLIQSSTTFSLVQGTTEYVMPNDFMATSRVWFFPPSGSSYIKLDQTSMDQLDAQSAGWTAATGPPTRYYLDRSSQSIYLGFFPSPSVTNSTGPVIVYYIQQPTDVTSTSQIPFNGNLILQPYVSALSYYVTYRGFQTVEETDLAKEYLQYWINFLGLMRQGIYKTPDYNPGFVGQRGP